MSINDDLRRSAEEFAQRNALSLGETLGSGNDGIVFLVQNQPENATAAVNSAVKAHRRDAGYRRERDVYMRIRDVGITSIRGCDVRSLLRFDDELRVIEMTVVARPFVLDFAAAELDWPPEFPDETLADWRAEKEEQFGRHWPEVQAILRALEYYGIFMVDVNPGNVSFPD
jgi:hypothetical protein